MQVHVYLFNDMLLLARPRRSKPGKYELKRQAPLVQVSVVDVGDQLEINWSGSDARDLLRFASREVFLFLGLYCCLYAFPALSLPSLLFFSSLKATGSGLVAHGDAGAHSSGAWSSRPTPEEHCRLRKGACAHFPLSLHH